MCNTHKLFVTTTTTKSGEVNSLKWTKYIPGGRVCATGAGLIGAVTRLSKFTKAEFSPKKLWGVFLPDTELCGDVPSSSLFKWDRSNGSGVCST